MTTVDIPEVVALQRRAFPKMPPWKQHELYNHIARFPDGQMVAVDPSGHVIGSSSSLVIRSSAFSPTANWNALTAEGTFQTHDALHGDTLYGAEIMVDPAARGMGVGSALYEARQALARRLNLPRMVAGGRIPGYGAVANQLSPEAYVAEVVAGKRRDSVLSFQLANGFHVLGVIPSYLSEDEASQGYATLIEWVNPAYHELRPAA